MRKLQEKVESFYQLDRDQRLFLDIALHEVRTKSKRGVKFVATNEFTRRRHKSTSLLIHAVESKHDILVRYGYMKTQIEKTLRRWDEEFGIDYMPEVFVVGEHLRGVQFENGLVAEELWKVEPKDIEHVLYQIRFGFMEQESLAELHRQGLL